VNWLYSTNAKEIGTLYLIFSIFAGMIGTAFSVLIRLELASPGIQFLQGDHQLFNVIISAHAFIMIFFMVMPGLVGGFGNYLLPVQIGAPDMAKIGKKNLNFYLSIKKSFLSLNKKEFNLNSFLAGLIEGDGYISINNKNKVLLGITFNIKDKPLAEKLLNYIGKGLIVKRKSNSIELRFTTVKSLEKIINLINGKMRTPKIDQLAKLIEWINKNHLKNINLLPLDYSNLLNNSWLAGFIDADGSFYIRNSLKQKICKFSLEQRMIYPKTKESYEKILTLMCQNLNVKLNIRTRLNYNDSYYIVRVENQKSIIILINYLKYHNLLSSKYLDFLEWEKAFNEIINKNHFTKEGNIILTSCKQKMNDKRTFFNWDHLNFFNAV